MLIKSLAGLALFGAVVATPFALATFNSAGAAACVCCGENCTCTDCGCDANQCSCSTGGSCACSTGCESPCCDKGCSETAAQSSCCEKGECTADQE